MLEYFWYGVRPAHVVLLPLSLLFAAVVTTRRWLYRVRALSCTKLPVPVLVVGNISVGGTGKTPTVLWLVDYLEEHGYRPGIIARGYGGSERLQEVRFDSDPRRSGDEPLLLARRAQVPVFVGRNRVQAAQALLAAYPSRDVLVSDDGLQHYALARDFEVAVVDGERWFGNGWMFPAGPLRESIQRLRRLDAVLIQGQQAPRALGAAQFTLRLRGETFHNVLNPQFKIAAPDLRDKALHAVAGIGNPRRFFSQLQGMGLTFRAHPFPDHFGFQSEDFDFAGDDTVVMTEKDAVKCAAFARENWWYLPVEAEVDPAFGDAVLTKLRSWHGQQAA